MYLRAPSVMALVITTLVLTACGVTNKRVENHALAMDISGLVRDHSADPTVLLRRPNAPTFASYNSFIIDPVRIDSSDRNMKDLDANDVAKMQRYFRDAVSKHLQEGGYRITSQPGAHTMRITFTMSGIKAPNALPNVVGLLAPIALSVGEVTVEAAFRNSETGRIDAVAVTSSAGSRVLNAKPWSTWGDVESALDSWAEGIRESVDAAHGR